MSDNPHEILREHFITESGWVKMLEEEKEPTLRDVVDTNYKDIVISDEVIKEMEELPRDKVLKVLNEIQDEAIGEQIKLHEQGQDINFVD